MHGQAIILVCSAGFDLWFKTLERNGLILFAASEGGQEEFVAVQLRSGRPWFLFDPQGEITNLLIAPFSASLTMLMSK